MSIGDIRDQLWSSITASSTSTTMDTHSERLVSLIGDVDENLTRVLENVAPQILQALSVFINQAIMSDELHQCKVYDCALTSIKSLCADHDINEDSIEVIMTLCGCSIIDDVCSINPSPTTRLILARSKRVVDYLLGEYCLRVLLLLVFALLTFYSLNRHGRH